MSALVAVVGGGPAGLSAAAELRRLGFRVVVIEREETAGGVPRHCGHTGFGLRDLRRVLSGAAYGRALAARARNAGADLMLSTTVTGWTGDGALQITSPRGRVDLRADAVVLATGCRERPRSARLIPGSRPAGVMTTGTLQQLVHLQGRRVGRRALIVGAEHVSYSAVATLADAGASVAALVTEEERHQSFAAFAGGARLRHRAPTLTRTRVERIHGRERVEGVALRDLRSGALREVACDLVVCTGDWASEAELAALAGLAIDRPSGAPAVDTLLRTSRPGVFAAGNVVHPAETADVAALGGRHAARAVAAHLRDPGRRWPAATAALAPGGGLRWIAPQLIAADLAPPARGRFVVRTTATLRRARVEVRQGGETLWRGRAGRVVAGRSAAIPSSWVPGVVPGGGPVTVELG